MVKYLSEYRDSRLIQSIVREIEKIAPKRSKQVMEVCGGHTVTILKYGIQHLLPKTIRLISGPGCPVCVTANTFIDRAIALSGRKGTLIATFGDMVRVPGSESSLQSEKARGADIRICYSPMDAVTIARANRDKEVIFLGIGFETTAPLVAAAVLAARQQSLANFSVLSAHKTMPRAMQALLDADEVNLDGFICPGHVSAITGTAMYDFIPRKYSIPCVVSGFEPSDMLESILALARQWRQNTASVVNQYTRCVKPAGNSKARAIMEQVFVACDADWRGIGVIPGSGLMLRDAFREYDAGLKFPIELPRSREYPGCICGDIMRGVRAPSDCKLFGKVCTPEDPKGACMVSAEGGCATHYKYATDAIK